MSSLYGSEFDGDSIRGVMIAVGRLVDDMVDDGRRLMVMVRELADNAVFHSGEGGGWCAVERSGDHLAVVIRDRGIGIRESLHDFCSDLNERWVFGGGVSATADLDRRLGLKMVLDYTRRGRSLLLETGGVAFVAVEGMGAGDRKERRRWKGCRHRYACRWYVADPLTAPSE